MCVNKILSILLKKEPKNNNVTKKGIPMEPIVKSDEELTKLGELVCILRDIIPQDDTLPHAKWCQRRRKIIEDCIEEVNELSTFFKMTVICKNNMDILAIHRPYLDIENNRPIEHTYMGSSFGPIVGIWLPDDETVGTDEDYVEYHNVDDSDLDSAINAEDMIDIFTKPSYESEVVDAIKSYLDDNDEDE